MSHQLSRRLSALASTMRELALVMHDEGSRIDRGGDYHMAYRLHQHADELTGAAQCALTWAGELARWESEQSKGPKPGGSDQASAITPQG